MKIREKLLYIGILVLSIFCWVTAIYLMLRE